MATDTHESVIDLLIAQHTEIKQLFVEVVNARGPRKRELFEDLVRLLAVHESAEEEVVHPTARRNIEDGSTVVDRRLQEESEAKQALADLYDLGVDHPQFESRLRMLADDVIRHATAEETEEFRQLRSALHPDELARMAGVFRAAEAAAPIRPHPMAGESAKANVLLGPPLAIFDRVRDAVREWGRRS
jgi:hemerythrin superfamily protein